MKKIYILCCLLIVALALLYGASKKHVRDDGEDTLQQKIFSTHETAQQGCVVHPYDGAPLEFSDIELDVRGGATCFFTMHKNSVEYFFHLLPDIELNTIAYIDVVKDAVAVQTIDASEMLQSVYHGQEFFRVVDANFDGYDDISLLLWSGATGNVGHGFWLFDPEKNIFAYDEKLSSLTSPVFDAKEKKIFSHTNGGMAGCIYGDAWYTYNADGFIEIIEQEIQDYDDVKNIFVQTKSMYDAGVLKDTRTTVVACGE